MRRTNQSGSILSFVIIGGVLVLLLVGGTYVVRHMLAPAATNPAPVAQKDDSSSNTKKDESTPDANKPNENNAPKTDTSTPSHTDTATLPSGSTAPEAQTLPTTGPGDVLTSGVMLGGLVASVAIYIRSRRELASL